MTQSKKLGRLLKPVKNNWQLQIQLANWTIEYIMVIKGLMILAQGANVIKLLYSNKLGCLSVASFSSLA